MAKKDLRAQMDAARAAAAFIGAAQEAESTTPRPRRLVTGLWWLVRTSLGLRPQVRRKRRRLALAPRPRERPRRA